RSRPPRCQAGDARQRRLCAGGRALDYARAVDAKADVQRDAGHGRAALEPDVAPARGRARLLPRCGRVRLPHAGHRHSHDLHHQAARN
nr:hypothetical protein [Tanacetum cinerariifolium]